MTLADRGTGRDNPVRRRRWPVVAAVVAAALVLGGTPFVVRSLTRSHATVAASVTPSAVASAATPTPTTFPATDSATPSPTPTPPWPTSVATGGPSVVPWADLPADPANDPVPIPPPVVDRSLTRCTIGQLAAVAGEQQGGGMGHGSTDIAVQRVSGPPCLLGDRVIAVSGLTANGNRISFDIQPLNPVNSADSGTAIELSGVNDVGNVTFAYYTRCDESTRQTPVREVEVKLANLGVLRVRSNDALRLGCAGQTILVSHAGAAQYQPSYPAVDLSAAMEAPPSVTRGGILHFVVTLTNTGGRTIPLSRCYNYVAILKFLPGGVGERHALNCAVAHDLAPGDRESFAMQLPVPASAAGPMPLVWSLDNRHSDISAHTSVVVTD